MRELWTGVPLYFVGVLVMVLGLTVYVILNPDRSNIPVLITAVGVMITALSQVSKGDEDDTKEEHDHSCLSGNFMDLLEQVVHEGREIRDALKESARKESAHVDRKIKKAVFLTACITVLATFLHRRR